MYVITVAVYIMQHFQIAGNSKCKKKLKFKIYIKFIIIMLKTKKLKTKKTEIKQLETNQPETEIKQLETNQQEIKQHKIDIPNDYLENKPNVIWVNFPVEPYFNETYEICNYGIVRHKKKKNFISMRKSGTGYCSFTLDVDEKNVPNTDIITRYRRTFMIHTHVANAFIDMIPEKNGHKRIIKFIKKYETLEDLHYTNLKRDYQSKNADKKDKCDIDDIDDNDRLKLKYIYKLNGNNNNNNNNNNDNGDINTINKDKKKQIKNDIQKKIMLIGDYEYEDKIIKFVNSNKITVEGKILKKFPAYLISNDGYIYKFDNGEKLAEKDVNADYSRHRLSNSGVITDYSTHRLIATLFIPNPDNLPEVNHINEKTKDNCVANLEWCTGSDNMKKHAENNNIGTRVHQIDLITNAIINTFDSMADAAKAVGLKDSTSIGKCLKGKQKSAGKTTKYGWKKANDDDINVN